LGVREERVTECVVIGVEIRGELLPRAVVSPYSTWVVDGSSVIHVMVADVVRTLEVSDPMTGGVVSTVGGGVIGREQDAVVPPLIPIHDQRELLEVSVTSENVPWVQVLRVVVLHIPLVGVGGGAPTPPYSYAPMSQPAPAGRELERKSRRMSNPYRSWNF
jgi:hypothetical protein